MKSVQHLARLARKGQGHRDWYRESRDNIMTTCYRNGWGVVKFCEVLAITSPRLSVVRNVRVAMSYMKHGQLPPTVISSTRAAMRHYEETGKIRGPKTSEFAEALLGNENAIVLDTWMAKALGIEQKKFDLKSVRQSAARRVRYTAYLMGWTPAQTQAAIWCGIVRKSGRKVRVIHLDDEAKHPLVSNGKDAA